MNSKEKLSRIFMLSGRASGRTTAILEGAKNTKGCVFVCAHQNQAAQIRERYPDIKVTTIDSLESLLGTNAPVLLDHFTWEMLFADLTRYYEGETEKLRRKLVVSSSLEKEEWISVKERLPEDYEDVLFLGIPLLTDNFRSCPISIGYKVPSGARVDPAGCGIYEDKMKKVVSFWRPLPLPPKPEEE